MVVVGGLLLGKRRGALQYGVEFWCCNSWVEGMGGLYLVLRERAGIQIR